MKLIIEIPESVYEAYKEWHKNKVATVEQSLIANSKPYEERPQGEWIGDTDYESFQGHYEAYKCNKCGYGLHWRDYCTNEYNFCPNCGAKMKGGAENDKD